jgi:hypothetical protein
MGRGGDLRIFPMLTRQFSLFTSFCLGSFARGDKGMAYSVF